MQPRDYQLVGALEGYKILKKYGIVYYAWQERCGKTLTALALCEMTKANKILIVTKKKAIKGWTETLGQFEHKKRYIVINYHSITKIKDDFDLVILDESHSSGLASSPKVGKIWKDVFPYTKGKPLIYLSATPYPEHLGQLYHQFALSSWSPFKQYRNFYRFFDALGLPYKTRTPYGLVETYTRYKDDEILSQVEHLFLHKTRSELGFEQEPEDVVHYYSQSPGIAKLQKEIIRTEMFRMNDIEIPLDSPMKLRVVAYQIEGGWVKTDSGCIELSYKDRIEAIKQDFGDGEDCVIMAHFTCEQDKLKSYFPKALVVSSTAEAEGVDYSHIENLIIYSMDFSTGRFQQRRARQANFLRKSAIKVHFYFAKGSVSEAVYETVAKKSQNFIKNSFERWAHKL